MEKNILITGAKMVLPHGIETGDLRISDGIISEISTKESIAILCLSGVMSAEMGKTSQACPRPLSGV